MLELLSHGLTPIGMLGGAKNWKSSNQFVFTEKKTILKKRKILTEDPEDK